MKHNLPKYDDFMLPTLKVLSELGGSGSIEEIQDRVAEAMNLTQEQLDTAYPKSGALIAPDRMSWARSYLKLAGLLASGGKGLWVLTDDGRAAALLSDAKVKRIVADAYNASVAAKKQALAGQLGNGKLAPQSDGLQESVLDWTDRLLVKLRTIDPSAFERLCQRVLRESGFVKVEVTGKSGDGGIDGSGVLRMNLISFQVLFQCKRYAGSVSSSVVRDFRGAMQGRADKGLIITTGNFTPDARREATRDGAPAIDLIDGEALCELLRDLRLGVEVREITVQEIEIDEQFFGGL